MGGVILETLHINVGGMWSCICKKMWIFTRYVWMYFV